MAQFTEEEKMLRRIDKRFSKGVVEYGLIEDGDKILIGLSGRQGLFGAGGIVGTACPCL